MFVDIVVFLWDSKARKSTENCSQAPKARLTSKNEFFPSDIIASSASCANFLTERSADYLSEVIT